MTKWKQLDNEKIQELLPGIRIYVRMVEDGYLQCFVAFEDGGWHMSICHKLPDETPGRYPVWDEIYDARYLFCPPDVTMAMFLPPAEEYVNIHETTFHLWEVKESQDEGSTEDSK